ncbi:hypothetical protein [Halobacillus mangrovi]|uniref:hypothetical protein n=1 Tax=Halobacillus mangrovi TaxID=402384 RepID=UPI003D993B7E
MNSPETRSINQAVHTPIINSERVGNHIEGFKPQMPFVKNVLLSYAFQDQKTSLYTLNQLNETDNQDVIFSAIKKIWEGDMYAATSLLSSIEMEEIVQFSKKVLRESISLLDKAKQDVEETITHIAKNNGVTSETISEIRKEIANLSNTLLTEIHSIGNPVWNNNFHNQPLEAVDLNGLNEATLGSRPLDNINTLSSPAKIELSKINKEILHSELKKRFPQTATFLSEINFLSVPSIANAADGLHLATFTEHNKHIFSNLTKMIDSLAEIQKVEPVGYLHLERLQFTPIGYERGELVYSVPLIPGEKIRLSHREWSRTEKEFTELISTSLETTSEEALSEKSELTESFNTQKQHNSSLNASFSASGGYGPVNIASSVGYNSREAVSSSEKNSAERSKEITKRASSRSKQEHKISFKVTNEYEVEEQSYREFTNTTTDAVRWDFHRLMQKWKIDLYRYGIRMTYDLVLPEPGSYLLRKHLQLKQLEDELNKPNPFDMNPSSIDKDNWMRLSAKYDTALEAPPKEPIYVSTHAEKTFTDRIVGFDYLEIAMPNGYEIVGVEAKGSKIFRKNGDTDNYEDNEDFSEKRVSGYIEPKKSYNIDKIRESPSNRYMWRYYYDWSENRKAKRGDTLTITLNAIGKPSESLYKEWQMRCFKRLADAAKVNYQNKIMRLTKMRDDLIDDLDREDSLMLRKIEKEEIMKGVLRWVLGPRFSFYPLNLPSLSDDETEDDLEFYFPRTQQVKDQYYEPAIEHGEIIKFLHQAIEWENVNYVLYPYFWTDTRRWDLKQFLFHDESIHRNFLRAGAARVVLTIRPGYEQSFLSFMETGKLGELLNDHPYMTIAEEMQQMSEEKYPYTPGANEENPDNLVDTWYEYTPTGALDVRKGEPL